MHIKYSLNNSIHYGLLVCSKHGFIKWLSERQYHELSMIIYGRTFEREKMPIKDALDFL
jgi:hypothetical protein